ncbi:MAG TPA: class II aldolase/adducin family protein, partial [Capillibacterium sp.]
NVSCRVDAESFVITPSGRSYQSLTPEDLVRVRIDDLSYEKGRLPSTERGVHAEVYKRYPAVNFVIHTHQENASVIAASGLAAIPVGPEYPRLGGRVLSAGYGLPGTKKLWRQVGQALAKSAGQAVIMKHHGALCFGADAAEAFAVASQLEAACAAFLLDRYWRASGRAEADPYAIAAFVLGLSSQTLQTLRAAGPKAYGYSRRTGAGFLWSDGTEEREVREGEDLAGLPALPAEVKVHRLIYRRNPWVQAIRFQATPELLCLAAAGLTIKPLLDDFAQIIGLKVRTVAADDPEGIARAFKKAGAVLVKDTGALCGGASEEDAAAAGMILQKTAKALIGASLCGPVRPLPPLDSMYLRQAYLRKYAKRIGSKG